MMEIAKSAPQSEFNRHKILPAVNLTILSFLGVFDVLEGPVPFWITMRRVYGALYVTWFAIYTVMMYLNCFELYEDFEKLSDVLALGVVFNVNVIKYLMLLRQRKLVCQLIEQITRFEQFLFDDADEQRSKIYETYKRQSHNITRAFSAVSALTLAKFLAPGLYYLLTGFDRSVFASKPLVFGAWYPFDPQHDRFYKYAYTIEAVSSVMCTTFICSWDTFYFALIICATGQIKVLEHMLLNAGRASEQHREYAPGTLHDINQCARTHTRVLRYIEDLNSAIKSILLIDFTMYSLFLCAIGLQLLIGTTHGYLAWIFSIEFFGAAVIQLFIYCYYGNEIMYQSSTLAMAVWKSDWYYFHPKYIKSMMIIMTKSQKVAALTIGPFYELSLEAFIIIIKSYFSLLTIMKKLYHLE